MKIKFKDRPSKELIGRYCKKLEEFLSAHNLTVSIELWDSPSRLESYTNGRLTGIKHIWIKKVMVKSPKIGEFSVRLMNSGIDEDIDEKKIWDDALRIQDQIYKHLDLKPQLPDDPHWKNDPYWRLWEYLKK